MFRGFKILARAPPALEPDGEEKGESDGDGMDPREFAEFPPRDEDDT